MIKKCLHRITVVWCLYGLVRVCIFANPWMFRLAKIIAPVWEDNSAYRSLEDVPWSTTDPFQIFVVWFCVCAAAFVVFLILAAIHNFTDWFFSTKNVK